MQCSNSTSRRLQIISLSSIGCAFATLRSDWKTAASPFSVTCASAVARDVCQTLTAVCIRQQNVHASAFSSDLAVCCAVVGPLVSAATMADLAAVSARRSEQGYEWVEFTARTFPSGSDPPLGNFFFSWFTDFLAAKTGRSVGKKNLQNNYIIIGPIMSSCRKKVIWK